MSGPGDVAGARDGGADRLLVVSANGSGERTPDAGVVRELRSATDLPLRVLLRGGDDYATSGSELTRLQGAARTMVTAGADGFAFGFLAPNLDLDVDAVLELATELDGLPWTLHEVVDHALDHERAWRRARGLPGLDTVLTAGSPRGLDAGLDAVCARAAADPLVAELVMAGRGLTPEHVPWLARAGVRKYHLGADARPGRSPRAYVDAALVRSWRTLVDDAAAAAL